ncbi:MAG: CBS domain-containing protein [Candidatus Caenarcaniphilales bacterium]|nr:CBS domain-containing protein [Candidatus Caenarcaniphilales bacterium]
MVSDYIEEELQMMDEGAKPSMDNISAAIEVNDPIRVLNLDYIHTVDQNTALEEALEYMADNNKGCVGIRDEAGALVGIFTERDLLRRVVVKSINMKNSVIKDYMTRNPQMLSEEDPIAFALNRMSDGSYRHIPIMKNGEVRYMLSVKDIVDQISLAYRDKVLNLPPRLNQDSSSQYGG